MSFANAALQIEKLKITNFRKFKSYLIEFNRQLTVLVGDNGTGKSTVYSYNAFTCCGGVGTSR